MIVQVQDLARIWYKQVLINTMFEAKKVHFIGIGGIGLSALAYWALEEGKAVTGSDSTDSTLIQDLRNGGAEVTIGHNLNALLMDTELVIYTEAIDSDTNPELLKAKGLGIPTMTYFQALGEISKKMKTIIVTGTHGKTTTTAMLGLALIEAGLDPTVIVGSKVAEFGGRNLRLGKSDLFIVEGCEYRRSFLNLKPHGLVVLNCEKEHLDYYKDEDDYVSAYKELAQKLPEDGFLVANSADSNVQKVVESYSGKVVRAKLEELELGVLGKFNQQNASMAYATAMELGAEEERAREALKNFKGTWRRLESKGEFKGAQVIDDYGHHPTEVKVTLNAIRKKYPNKRVVCVFQPHQHSRTHHFLEEFKSAFGDSDVVMISGIYSVRDQKEDKDKINAEQFARAIHEKHEHVEWWKGLDETYVRLKETIKPDDVVVTMGAGSIGNLADKLVSDY